MSVKKWEYDVLYVGKEYTSNIVEGEGKFIEDLNVFGEEGDVLICYSTSGSSKNIIKAAAEAKRKKCMF